MMSLETLSSTNTRSQDDIDSPTLNAKSTDAIRDRYSPGVQVLPDAEKMSAPDQLRYLSNVAETADADTWYSVFEAGKILANVANDSHFSPLARAVAGSLNSDVDGYDDDNIPREEYGYSSIVTPDMTPDGVLTDEVEMMNEKEIMTELERLSELEKKLPHEIEPGSPEEDAFMEYVSRQNELEFALSMIYFRRNQARLHREFPSAPKDKQLVKIAPDAAGTLDFQEKYDKEDSWFVFGSSIDSILYQDGRDISPDENAPALDGESVLYLKIVHGNTSLKASISEMINIDLNKIPLEAQAYLLKFMAKSDNGRFDRLCKTLHGISDEKARLKLAEGFLAAGFGEDFGDALLDIANSKRFSGEQLGEILGQVESCRSSIRRITEMYKDYDGGKFANKYARAANERLTDAITVFQEIARDGTATANLDWAGTPRFTYSSAMEALKYEAKSLSIISGTVGDVATGKEGAFAELLLTPDESRTRSMYSFYSPEHGYVLLYTRPEASSTYENSLEYGNRSGVEASISLITNPVNPFELPTPFKPNSKAVRNPNYYDPATMDRVSAIRIDREGRTLDMAANDSRRHPLNHEGIASVDLAAIGDRADTPSGKIARLFSVGNALRAARVGGEIKLNHNTNWFDQDKFGTDVGFKSVADYVDRLAITWCAEHPSSEDQGFRAATRQARPSAKRRRSAA